MSFLILLILVLGHRRAPVTTSGISSAGLVVYKVQTIRFPKRGSDSRLNPNGQNNLQPLCRQNRLNRVRPEWPGWRWLSSSTPISTRIGIHAGSYTPLQLPTNLRLEFEGVLESELVRFLVTLSPRRLHCEAPGLVKQAELNSRKVRIDSHFPT